MSKINEYALKIKRTRLDKNMSQHRFGEKIGVSGKTVSSYETGRASPPLKVLEKMENIYDVWFVVTKKEKKEALKEKLDLIQKALEEIALTLDVNA
jgi:transcriptional regulator with XRE-family HTH domain